MNRQKNRDSTTLHQPHATAPTLAQNSAEMKNYTFHAKNVLKYDQAVRVLKSTSGSTTFEV